MSRSAAAAGAAASSAPGAAAGTSAAANGHTLAFGKVFKSASATNDDGDQFPWEIAQQQTAASSSSASSSASSSSSSSSALDKQVPYREQRDDELYTQENIRRRNALKKNPLIAQQINRMWMLLKKNSKGRLEKFSYMNLMIRLCKILNPDFQYAEALKVRHCETIDFHSF